MQLKLSPSASSRWLICPGSVQRESLVPPTTNKYAQEGIEAHAVAASILEGKEVDDTVPPAILEYIYYVWTLKEQAGKTLEFIEKRLESLDKTLPLSGTVDYLLLDIDKQILHVVDFKYGRGIPVFAENNSQLLLYAYLALEFLGFSYTIETIGLHIMQPRCKNTSCWTISVEELHKIIETIKESAREALKVDAFVVPSPSSCQFCKAKCDCKEYQIWRRKRLDFFSGTQDGLELFTIEKL